MSNFPLPPLKSLKFAIQYSPLAGDPDNWIVDIQVCRDDNGHEIRGEESWKAGSFQNLITALPKILERYA